MIQPVNRRATRQRPFNCLFYKSHFQPNLVCSQLVDLTASDTVLGSLNKALSRKIHPCLGSLWTWVQNEKNEQALAIRHMQSALDSVNRTNTPPAALTEDDRYIWWSPIRDGRRAVPVAVSEVSAENVTGSRPTAVASKTRRTGRMRDDLHWYRNQLVADFIMFWDYNDLQRCPEPNFGNFRNFF